MRWLVGTLGPSLNSLTQGFEVSHLHRHRRLRRATYRQQAPQSLAILVLADEIAHVLTTDAIATQTYLVATFTKALS